MIKPKLGENQRAMLRRNTARLERSYGIDDAFAWQRGEIIASVGELVV